MGVFLSHPHPLFAECHRGIRDRLAHPLSKHVTLLMSLEQGYLYQRQFLQFTIGIHGMDRCAVINGTYRKDVGGDRSFFAQNSCGNYEFLMKRLFCIQLKLKKRNIHNYYIQQTKHYRRLHKQPLEQSMFLYILLFRTFVDSIFQWHSIY